ncbi:hypothetical protein HYY74_05610 [Candidatus Woesearchaeota archaeon]|nr:hypothetical protein [Candidatus Woesearchaeota archaeon]
MSLDEVVRQEASRWPADLLELEHIRIEKEDGRPSELIWHDSATRLTPAAVRKARAQNQGDYDHHMVSFSEYYWNSKLLDNVTVLGGWVEAYEQLYQPNFVETVDYLLRNLSTAGEPGSNLEEYKQAYRRGFIPKVAYAAAADLWGSVFQDSMYRRPEELAALINDPQGLVAYSTKAGLFETKGRIGIGGYGPFNFIRLMRELDRKLGLSDDPSTLKYYIVGHELEHLKNPNLSEEEVRERLYEKYADLAKDGSDDEVTRMYRAVAAIAHAVAYGHAGVGGLSRAMPRKIYGGLLEGIDKLHFTSAGRWHGRGPYGGSLLPHAQGFYREAIGVGPFMADAPVTHEPAQHNAVPHKAREHTAESPAISEHSTQEAAEGAQEAYQASEHTAAEHTATEYRAAA